MKINWKMGTWPTTSVQVKAKSETLNKEFGTTYLRRATNTLMVKWLEGRKGSYGWLHRSSHKEPYFDATCTGTNEIWDKYDEWCEDEMPYHVDKSCHGFVLYCVDTATMDFVKWMVMWCGWWWWTWTWTKTINTVHYMMCGHFFTLWWWLLLWAVLYSLVTTIIVVITIVIIPRCFNTHWGFQSLFL